MAASIAASQKSVWGFSPQSIPGLSLWMDAADRSSMTFSSGSDVSLWKDKSGNGNNGTPTTYFGGSATTVTLAQNSIGGLPAIQLTGVSSILGNLALSGSGVSMIYVFKMLSATPAAPRTIVITRPGVSDASFDPSVIGNSGTNTGTVFGYGRLFSGQSTYATTSIPLSTDTLFSCWSDGTFTFVSRNGGSTVTSQSGTLGNLNTSVYAIGSQYINDTTSPFTGYIGEVLVYNNNLTTPQRQQVEGYLAAKWGMIGNLPTTHPYSSVIPILPTQIPGCQLWLDAADTSTITGTSSVTAWADKSGNGNTATSSGTANPVLTQNLINGVQGISFPNTGTSPNPKYFFDGPISLTGTSITSFVVCVPSSVTVTAASPPRILSLAAAGAVDYTSALYFVALYQYLTSFAVYRYSGGNIATVAANTPYVMTTVATPGNIAGYQNGVGPTNITASIPSGNFSVSRFRIANEFNPATSLFNGNIGEVIVFNTALSTSQRQLVEQYLGQKWKVSVANAPSPGRYLIPANRPFYPTDIPGCTLWLDAADRSSITLSSGSLTDMSRWKDKSGQGTDFTVTEGTPVYSNTSYLKPTVVFPANSQMLSVSSASETGAASRTMFAVADVPAGTQTNFGTGYIPTEYQSIGFNFATVWNNGLGSIYTYYYTPYVFSANDIVRNTASIPNTTTNIAYASYNSNTSTMTGRYGTIDADISKSFTLATAAGPWYIGDRPTNGTTGFAGKTAFGGSFCEIINFNSVLSTTQRQQVEQYLTWKWGLPVANLPTGHPGKLLPAFGTAFTPKSISGCALWLDAADISTMTLSLGSNVSSWNDKSGNARNFSNTANFPVYTATGVQFTGSTPTVLSNAAGYSATNTLTTFVVYRSTVAGTRQRYFVSGRTGNFNVFQGDSTFISAATTSLNNYQGVSFNANTTYLISQVGYSPSSISWAIDGSGSTVWQAVEAPATATSIRFSVGGEATVYFTGFIMEVLMFDTFFTRSQQQQVEGYLAWKWGLQRSLPSTHAYAKFSP